MGVVDRAPSLTLPRATRKGGNLRKVSVIRGEVLVNTPVARPIGIGHGADFHVPRKRAPQSSLAPEILTCIRNLSTSVAMNCLNSAGELPTGSLSPSAKCALTFG